MLLSLVVVVGLVVPFGVFRTVRCLPYSPELAALNNKCPIAPVLTALHGVSRTVLFLPYSPVFFSLLHGICRAVRCLPYCVHRHFFFLVALFACRAFSVRSFTRDAIFVLFIYIYVGVFVLSHIGCCSHG